jgi:hypothetical protein
VEATREPEELLLDGQQRVTSLFQALIKQTAVDTHTAKKKKRRVFYYFDIEKALHDPLPDEAIEIVDHTKRVTENIGRDIIRDLSVPHGEYAHMRFPAKR